MNPIQKYLLASVALSALGTAITEPGNLRVRNATEFNNAVYRDLAIGAGVGIVISGARGYLRKTILSS